MSATKSTLEGFDEAIKGNGLRLTSIEYLGTLCFADFEANWMKTRKRAAIVNILCMSNIPKFKHTYVSEIWDRRVCSFDFCAAFSHFHRILIGSWTRHLNLSRISIYPWLHNYNANQGHARLRCNTWRPRTYKSAVTILYHVFDRHGSSLDHSVFMVASGECKYSLLHSFYLTYHLSLGQVAPFSGTRWD